MNKVIITGKIVRDYRESEKVIYATICTWSGKSYEFIPVTIFQVDYYKRYFYKEKWITIEGYIHVNKRGEEYETEIIASNLYFAGEMSDTDKLVNEYYNEKNTMPLEAQN